VLSGDTYAKWAAQGWERGALGYPTRDVTCGLPDGGCFQHFQGGSIYDSASTPAAIVPTSLRTKWAASGWEKGPLGYPTRDAVCGLKNGGCFQHFQGGSIYKSSSTPAAIVAGAIRTQWAEQGWERGPLGYPLADAATVSGKLTQKFQGGTLRAP
jgi:uncharacterized protein with LGFP repeats